MTGITAVIAYRLSALAQIKWRLIDHRTLEAPRFVRDLLVAVLSLVFSVLIIGYSRNTGNSFWIYWATFFLTGGVLLGHPGVPRAAGSHDRAGTRAAVPMSGRVG